MPDPRRLFGTHIEQRVAAYLKENGYQVLAHQYRTAYGEIDLVCQEGNEIVFVEVKARQSAVYGFPEESVDARKVKRLVRCAQAYLQKTGMDTLWRIDVVAVECDPHVHIVHLKAVDIPDGF